MAQFSTCRFVSDGNFCRDEAFGDGDIACIVEEAALPETNALPTETGMTQRSLFLAAT